MLAKKVVLLSDHDALATLPDKDGPVLVSSLWFPLYDWEGELRVVELDDRWAAALALSDALHVQDFDVVEASAVAGCKIVHSLRHSAGLRHVAELFMHLDVP